MSFTRDDLLKLLEMIEVTTAEEIDCDEFLERVGAYVERLDPDAEPPPGYEDVVQHLRICPECLEELEALYLDVRGEEPGDARDASAGTGEDA
jgi:hypothetical protein